MTEKTERKQRAEIAAICGQRYADGRPRWPAAYVAALYGVSPRRVREIYRDRKLAETARFERAEPLGSAV